MAQEQNEIRDHIAETRRQIDADLDAITRRVNTLTDWRKPLREHSLAVAGAGLLGGLVAGWVLGG